MGIFIKSLELAAPLLLLTALGYFLKKMGMLDDRSSAKLSRLVLDVILPVSIFNYIYESDFRSAFDLKLISFLIIVNLILVIGVILLAHVFTSNKKQLGAFIQTGVRGNYSIFALPLAISIYGNDIAAPMTIAIAFLTPLYNIFAMALFEHYQDSKINVFKQIINVLKTPIVLATFIGITLNLLQISLPKVIVETLNYIGKSVTAVSLINLGSSFNFKINKNIVKLVGIALLYKLVIVPLVMLPSGVLLGFKDMALVVILVIATSPIATSSFSTAVCYDTDIELTSSAVVYSYLFCSITIPLFLSIVTYLGLI